MIFSIFVITIRHATTLSPYRQRRRKTSIKCSVDRIHWPLICWRKCLNWIPTNVSQPNKLLHTSIWRNMPIQAMSPFRLCTTRASKTWTYQSRNGKVSIVAMNYFGWKHEMNIRSFYVFMIFCRIGVQGGH